MAGGATAEVFTLDPVVVPAGAVHPSQEVRGKVLDAMNSSRTSSSTNGAALQNINPVNKSDALRYNTIGTIGGPGAGTRFGGSTKIRTFGDFGAAESIDGLPAFRASGSEGGGYTGTVILSIAIDTISLQKGGRAVGYGDGSDGGIVETTIKSGRGYKDHAAVSTDINTANEALVQGEYADSTDKWDVYGAANFLEGHYNGEPPELDKQRQFGGLGKVGLNFGETTRLELLGIGERNRPDIYRNGNLEKTTSHTYIGAATLDTRTSEETSARVGYEYIDTNARWPARNRNRSIDTHIGFTEGYWSTDLSESIQYDASVGAEYKRTNYLRDNQYDLVFHDMALKTTNALTFNDNLVLNMGLRPVWFRNDLYLNGAEQADNLETPFLLAYEAGAAYTVFGQTRLRASVATGYNRFYSKYGNFGNDAFNPAGAQDQVVESQTLETGLRQGWDRGYADIAVYNIVQENVPRRNGGAIQNVEVEQSGIEFETQHGFDNGLTLSAGLMYILDVKATRDDGTDANGNVFFGTNGVPVPELQALVRAEYAIAPDWVVWGMGYHNSGYTQSNSDGTSTELRDYYRADLGVAWQPTTDVALRFRVENIFDEKDFGQTVEGMPAADADKIGRVFWLGVDYTF
jgi:outer membrane cobalamin receptor